MKTIVYFFSKIASNGDKANLGKLLKIREKKGITNRLGRGIIEVQEESIDEITDLIQRYHGELRFMDEAVRPTEIVRITNQIQEKIAEINQTWSKRPIPSNSEILDLLKRKGIAKDVITKVKKDLRSQTRKFISLMLS